MPENDYDCLHGQRYVHAIHPRLDLRCAWRAIPKSLEASQQNFSGFVNLNPTSNSQLCHSKNRDEISVVQVATKCFANIGKMLSCMFLVKYIVKLLISFSILFLIFFI